MAEISQVVSLLNKPFPLRLIKSPGGSWIFVGRVPIHLSYRQLDGSLVTDKQAYNIRQFGPGLLKREVKSLGFATREEAIAEAAKFNAEVSE